MARLDNERQERLEPLRVKNAITEIEKLGITVVGITDTELRFVFKDEVVRFFPYSGWHTGKSIQDGRGLKKLLNQINK